MQTAKLLRFLADQGGEYRSERGTLSKELAVALRVPVQEVRGALRRLENAGLVERTFALGRTHSIRLVCRVDQPTPSEGVGRGRRRSWVDTVEDRVSALESDISHLGEVVERLTGILLQELERDPEGRLFQREMANSMVVRASKPPPEIARGLSDATRPS